ncbi:unnamed protein product [Cunninghamella echinulata]
MTKSPKCPNRLENYLLPKTAPNSISSYFKQTPVKKWSLRDFVNWHRSKAQPFYFNKVKEEYQQSLNTILTKKKSLELPRDIASHVGELLKFSMTIKSLRDNQRTTEQVNIVSLTNNKISGSNITIGNQIENSRDHHLQDIDNDNMNSKGKNDNMNSKHENDNDNNSDIDNDAVDEFDIIENNNSFSSIDEAPSKTTRSMITMDLQDDKELDNSVPEDERWLIDDVDISQYLFNYRQQSLYHNQFKTHRNLSAARLLSLHHIFLFTEDHTNSCMNDYSLSYDDIYNDLGMNREDDFGFNAISWAYKLLKTSKTNDEFELTLTMANILSEAANNKDDKNSLIMAHVLVDLTKSLTGVSNQFSLGEDTFIHKFLAPFFNNIFKSSSFSIKWANVQLIACSSHSSLSSSSSSSSSPSLSSTATISSFTTSSLTSNKRNHKSIQQQSQYPQYMPDLTVSTVAFGRAFDLFCAEAKAPKSGKAEDDYVKLGYELKIMIDYLVDNGISNPTVCGAWIDDFNVKLFKMDLKYNGIYRMMEFNEFKLPESIEDIVKVPVILPYLLTLKDIIMRNVDNIITILNNKKHKKLSTTPINLNFTRSSVINSQIYKKMKNNY